MPRECNLRIDHGMKPTFHFFAIVQYDGYLGNAVGRCMAARGFYINNCIHKLEG